MRGYFQQGRGELVGGWLLAALATAVYLLTMNRSVDWWDCGEFLATSYGLQVGHPPGAPFYQLVVRCVMMLSFGNPLWVAPLGNAVSAVCGGVTVMVLYRTSREMGVPAWGAATGALCYLFCDTVWFSAVESEVYAMAMLFCSVEVWLVSRWRRRGDGRRLLLAGLLAGLGVCVHLMTLLVVPALLWLVFSARPRVGGGFLCGLVFFFFLGLTPYVVVPLRAASNPPINQMGGSFKAYVGREQYPHAPLYPRLWRERDEENWRQWSGGDPGSFLDNACHYATYQLGYMYLRYVMYNFIGRANLAYTSDGEGRPVFDFRYAIFVVPFLLGVWGMVWQWRRRRRGFAAVGLLFLFGGVVLNFYLNHPCYEPRERDYAYVLSFYAFALWIGEGAGRMAGRRGGRWMRVLVASAPLTLAFGNWADHDRSRNRLPHDIAAAHLESCEKDAILVTYGDNDTYPLWYLQQVEGLRTDVTVVNVNLEGYYNVVDMLGENAFRRPVYLTAYTHDAVGGYLPGHGRCEGFVWRLFPTATAGVLMGDRWQGRRKGLVFSEEGYVDPVSRSFLKRYEEWVRGK